MKKDNKSKLFFFLILGFSFIIITVFNICTPLMSDDFPYMEQARSAHNLWDIILQEYNQYMNWNGRSVTFVLYRILLCAPILVQKIANSIVFITLSILVYLNIKDRKKYDVLVMSMVQLGMWIFTVSFSQTILWECGAFVYLWGMTIVMGFLTTVRHLVVSERKCGVVTLILVFLFGWAAGWCNENTSGGALLLLLIAAGMYKYVYKKKIPGILFPAILGNMVGLGFLVLGPGVRKRATLIEENHSGLYGIFARLQKLTLYNKEAFLVLLILFAATIIWSLYYYKRHGKTAKEICYELRYRLAFFVVYFATVYALVATAVPEIRALFGAGVFLQIAVIQGIVDNVRKNADGEGDAAGQILRFAYSVAIVGMSLYLFFDIVDCGAMLVRIKRDDNERIEYIRQQVESGNTYVVVAKYHEAFDNHYTCAYEMDLEEDPGYWTNVLCLNHYGLNSISAIPYEEWEEQYKNGN